MRRHAAGLLALTFVFALSPTVDAYTVDIGYDALQAELGASTPTGAGVRVAQVEAPINDVSGGASPIFMPDLSYFEFIGKTITPVGGNPSGAYSGHATGVGSLFYGTNSSIAPGITSIDSYEAISWISSLYVSMPGPNYGKVTTSPDASSTIAGWAAEATPRRTGPSFASWTDKSP